MWGMYAYACAFVKDVEAYLVIKVAHPSAPSYAPQQPASPQVS